MTAASEGSTARVRFLLLCRGREQGESEEGGRVGTARRLQELISARIWREQQAGRGHGGVDGGATDGAFWPETKKKEKETAISE